MSIQLTNIKTSFRKMLIAGASASILTAAMTGIAQASNSESIPPQVEAIRTKMMQYYKEQTAALKPDAANLWQKAALAPSDFPAPVFKGNGTVFIVPKMPQGIQGLQNVRQMILRTKDSPTLVASWYQNILPATGLKLLTDGPKVTRPGMYIIRAESNKLTCNVFVTSRDSAGTDTTINITTVQKTSG